MENELTYQQQIIQDNTWKKDDGTFEDECPHCGFFAAHPSTQGSTIWDRYSYLTCVKCFKTW